MGSKSNIDYTFKHCRKGHYYQGDECPFCNKIQQFTANNAVKMSNMKVCINGHAYDRNMELCPYCGEDTCFASADMTTGWYSTLKINFKSKHNVQIDKHPGVEVTSLEISYLQHNYRTGYHICGLPDFNFKSEIRWEGRVFTGAAFIHLVDFLISEIKGIENK